MSKQLTRRLFLKRAGSAVGVIAFLPLISRTKVSQTRVAQASSDYFEHTILAMGTTARLGLYAASEKLADHAINKAFAELKLLESLMTIYDASSELSSINRNAGIDAVVVSDDTYAVIERACKFSELTGGAFDITVEPLMRLWGFRNAKNVLITLPTDEEVFAALQNVGAHHVQFDANTNSVGLDRSGCKLDLGGIAVGYALDKMKAILLVEGIHDFFLDISGDIIAMGSPLDSEGWQVAIPDPNGTGELVYQTMLKGQALATSGNYMSFVIYQAKQFGHIMDPHMGRSANRILSSTVIAKEGIAADALSTGSFVSATAFKSDAKFVFVETSGAVRFA